MLILDNIEYKIDNFSLGPLNISIEKGEYLALFGASGSGKSTLLEIISGIRKPKKGRIILNNRDITNIAPQKRDISIVFQDYALFPNMTVFENIAYPLKIRKIDKQKMDENINELSQKLKIETLLKRYPLNLSGGEKQRVALSRAIIHKPSLLLLDEPLSALDQDLRVEAIDILRKIKSFGITTIHVSHNKEEAKELASSILYL